MLKHDQIKESSVIFIEFEDSKQNEPYLVVRKSVGSITKAMMLLGFKFSDLFDFYKKNIDFNPFEDSICLDRFYIKYENDGKHKGVKFYRRLSSEEKYELLTKVRNLNLLEVRLADAIANS